LSSKSKKARLAALAVAKTPNQVNERRSKFFIYGTGLILSLAIIGSTTVFILNERSKEAVLTEAASKPIAGVNTFTDLARTHNSTPTLSTALPPTGGDHNPSPITCGVYTTPVDTLKAVHSLEHGAVWITYQPGLPADQLNSLAKTVASNPYQLLSPYPSLQSPIVLSAWGKQLQLEDAKDPRLPIFLKAFTQGPQTPEPGAPC
jgi:hypothetical protein